MKRKNLKDKLKKRFSKEKTEKTDHADLYDNLTQEEQDAYWDGKGYCIFREITGENFYPQFVIEKAFTLYLDGVEIEGIADKWNILPSTLRRWEKKYAWEQKLEKIQLDVESKLLDEKAKDVYNEKTEINNRHKRLLKWLQLEFGKEWKSNANDEIRLTRVKTLKIISDAYNTIIKLEREIIGLDQADITSVEIPTDFTFIVTTETQAGALSEENLKSLLPNQDPHDYPIEGDDPNDIPLALSDAKLQLTDGSQENSFEPVMVTARRLTDDLNIEPNKPKPHPATGWINLGNNF